LIDVRGFVILAAIATEVALAEIVHEDEDHIDGFSAQCWVGQPQQERECGENTKHDEHPFE
jgi:hypothetical protein